MVSCCQGTLPQLAPKVHAATRAWISTYLEHASGAAADAVADVCRQPGGGVPQHALQWGAWGIKDGRAVGHKVLVAAAGLVVEELDV